MYSCLVTNDCACCIEFNFFLVLVNNFISLFLFQPFSKANTKETEDLTKNNFKFSDPTEKVPAFSQESSTASQSGSNKVRVEKICINHPYSSERHLVLTGLVGKYNHNDSRQCQLATGEHHLISGFDSN